MDNVQMSDPWVTTGCINAYTAPIYYIGVNKIENSLT